MAVNKVVFGNTTVMDITDSTVTASKLKSGETAYAANGAKITGELVVPEVLDDLSDVTINTPANAHEIYYDGSQWINYGAKILLTFDDAFQGQTITLSKDQTIITKVAPSTGNSMSLYISETGEWTISSTIDEETYETVVTITTFGITYTAELESTPSTPEGATVEPTDDIQIWLACANLNKPYTTLAEVLADRETFETLIADSNACDYMARSTTWALNSGAVPTMTSDTTPSGTVIYSSQSSGTDGYKAFDKLDSGYWLPTTSATNNYLGYTFDTPQVVNKVTIRTRKVSSQARTLKIEKLISNTWTEVGSVDVTAGTSTVTFVDYEAYIQDDTPSTSYRIFCSSTLYVTSSWALGIAELQFFTDADITTNQDAMSLIGKYDYCSNALLNNATWCEAIANSDYFEEVLNVKVPVMTSATTPSGVVYTSSDLNSDRAGYKAFDNNSSTSWHSSAGVPQSIAYEFTEPINVRFVKLLTFGAPGPKTSKIQYSLDGNTYNDYSDDANFVDCTTANTWYSKVYFSDIQAKYFRLNVTESNYSSGGSYYVGCSELQFYGRSSSEVNIIHGPANDTIYTYEEGSPVTVATTNSDGDGILDFSELEDKVYTLYSTVAKNPNDLTLPFTRRIRITKSQYGGTTERYLVPDTIRTLYWYGYKNNIESMVTSNGWSRSSYTFNAPTYNTINVDCNANGSTVINGVSSTYKPTVMDRMCILATGVTAVNGSYGNIKTEPSKAIDGSSATRQTLYDTNTLKFYVNNNPIENNYFTSYAIANRRYTLHGMWYENTIETPTFISAVYDSLYIMDGNTKIWIANTDGEGKSLAPMLEPGTYTIYSSVAKDPNNLSNPYSKTVTVDESTQTIKVMPENTLYWWGYEGKSFSSQNPNVTNVTFQANNVTKGINDFHIYEGTDATSYRGALYATDDIISIGDATVFKVLVKDASLSRYSQANIANTGYFVNNETTQVSTIVYSSAITSPVLISSAITVDAKFGIYTQVIKQSGVNGTCDIGIYAMWLE